MSDAVDVVSNNEAEMSNDMSTSIETDVTKVIQNLKHFQEETGFKYLGHWVIPRAYRESMEPVHEELGGYIRAWIGHEHRVSVGEIVDRTAIPKLRLDFIKHIVQSIDKFMTQLQRCFQNKNRSILTILEFDRVELEWDPTFGDMTPHQVYMEFKTLTDELKTSLSELSAKLNAIEKKHVEDYYDWIIHKFSQMKIEKFAKGGKVETESQYESSSNPYLIEFNMNAKKKQIAYSVSI